MIDKFTADLESGQRYPSPEINIMFETYEDGQYIQLKNVETTVSQIAASQGIENLQSNQKLAIVKNLNTEIKRFWKSVCESWTGVPFVGDHQVSVQEMEHFGKACSRVTKDNQSGSGLKDFIRSKYNNVSFKAAETEDVSMVITETKTLRPHIVKSRASRYLIFTSDGKTIMDISEEVRLTVFEWEDVRQLASKDFFVTEQKKFDAGINSVVQVLNERIASMNRA